MRLPRVTIGSRARLLSIAVPLTIVAVVVVVWCASYHRWSRREWKTPLEYGGDAIPELTGGKAMAVHDVYPILPKHPSSFNAPFIANWNDYPSVEEGIWAWQGLLTGCFGTMAGANAAVLCAQIFAALALYFVCRHFYLVVTLCNETAARLRFHYGDSDCDSSRTRAGP